MSSNIAPVTTKTAEDTPIYIDTQHDDMIHDAQMDYYGCKLATCSSDRTVKIYDVAGSTYAHTATLQGHEGPVWEVAWSHPMFGVLIASCSFDGSVLIHREIRPREWVLIHSAKNLHESSVNSVSFCPHEYGLILAAASSDGRVSILTHNNDDSWSVEYIRDNSLGVNAVSWAPCTDYTLASMTDSSGTDSTSDSNEGAKLAMRQDPPRLVTAGCDNRIRFWIKSLSTGQWEEDRNAVVSRGGLSHTDWVRDVAWAPSLIPGMNVVASCSEDRTVIIWTQKCKNEEQSNWEPTLLNKFDAPVWRVSWSITGNILAVSSGDDNVTLWKQTFDGAWAQVSKVEEPPSQNTPTGNFDQ